MICGALAASAVWEQFSFVVLCDSILHCLSFPLATYEMGVAWCHHYVQHVTYSQHGKGKENGGLCTGDFYGPVLEVDVSLCPHSNG